jgi:microcystin-dependent protein
MGTPFLAEVRIVSFNYPPKGWAFCNGQILPINQNQALFSLMGTMYGGDGVSNFALPNLQGRVPIHYNANHAQGSTGGAETHALGMPEIPQHRHNLIGVSSIGNCPNPVNRLVASTLPSWNAYSPTEDVVVMGGAATASTGSGLPHQNMQPYLVLNYVIALQGIFPSRN